MGGELLPAAPLQPCAGALQRGDICSLAGLTWPQVMSSSNNVLLAVQAWGTPSAWRHVPRPPIRWVLSGRWVLSEPCQYIPCPLLPTTWSRVLFARHNINMVIYFDRNVQLNCKAFIFIYSLHTFDLTKPFV